MFIKRNRNRSGSVSIQIIKKIGRRNKVLKTVGCGRTYREEELLLLLAKTEIELMQGMQSLFIEHDDAVVDNLVDSIGNENLQIVDYELFSGKIYHQIGYP